MTVPDFCFHSNTGPKLRWRRHPPCAGRVARHDSTVVRKALLAICALSAWALGACTDAAPSVRHSISIADGGRTLVVLERNDTGHTVHLHDDAGRATPMPELSLSRPLEVSLSPDGGCLLFVTRSTGATQEPAEWVLWRKRLSSDDAPRALIASPIFLASPVETGEGEVAFLRGTQRLGGGRVSAQWVALREGTPARVLSNKPYGYRMGPTVLGDLGLVLLNSEGVGSAAAQIVDFVPFAEATRRPDLPGDDVGKRTVGFGCDRRGLVCYRLDNTDAPGRSFYHHRLALHRKGSACDANTGHDWIDTVALSRDGGHLALIGTTFDDKRNIVDRRLLVFRVSEATCATETFARKLHPG